MLPVFSIGIAQLRTAMEANTNNVERGCIMIVFGNAKVVKQHIDQNK